MCTIGVYLLSFSSWSPGNPGILRIVVWFWNCKSSYICNELNTVSHNNSIVFHCQLPWELSIYVSLAPWYWDFIIDLLMIIISMSMDFMYNCFGWWNLYSRPMKHCRNVSCQCQYWMLYHCSEKLVRVKQLSYHQITHSYKYLSGRHCWSPYSAFRHRREITSSCKIN